MAGRCALCLADNAAATQREALLQARLDPCPHGRKAADGECADCDVAVARAARLLEAGQGEGSVPKLAEAVQLQQPIFRPTALPLLQAAQALLTAAIDQQQWVLAEAACALTVAAFERLYKANWPLLGLQLLMLGKLEKLLAHLPAAARHLEAAYPILCKTHGSDHPLVRSLVEMRDEVAAEMRHGNGPGQPPALT